MSADNVDGDAEVRDGALAVRLKEPKRETITLQGRALFPVRAPEAPDRGGARRPDHGIGQGVRRVGRRQRVYDTLALIGRRIDPGAGANLEPPAKHEALAKLPRWPMTISYFKAGTGDQTPAYTISFELYENGISRALKLDYGDFALKGDLANLEVLPFSACDR